MAELNIAGITTPLDNTSLDATPLDGNALDSTNLPIMPNAPNLPNAMG
jgi:hypothetical protein